MSTPARSTIRTTGVALRAMLLFTLVLGIGYTLVVTGIGQLLLPWQANGSPVQNAAGETVGSALIGRPRSSRRPCRPGQCREHLRPRRG